MKQRSFNAIKVALISVLTLSAGMTLLAQNLKPLPVEEIAKIKAILPDKLTAKSKSRKILIFWRCEGYVHGKSIEYSLEAFKLTAKKFPAYKIDFSRDYADLSKKNLEKYDALVLNNTTKLNTKENFTLEYDLINFVKSGKGLAVIHAAADNFYEAEAAAEMVGGRFWGHPWGAGGTWAFKLDEPSHPINSSFPNSSFKWGDEIYQQQSPFYNRSKLRVLISLDFSDKATAEAKGQKRADKDYAVSWIRSYGKGRVFYTSFAHDQRSFLDKAVFGHILNGIQYVAGDLKVDDSPLGLSANDINFVKGADSVTVNKAFALLQNIIRNTNDKKVNKANLAKLEATLIDKSVSPFAKQAILRTLLSCGIQPKVEAITPSLSSKDSRNWAITILAGMDSSSAMQALRLLLASPEAALRVNAINALAIHKNSEAIIPMMTDKDDLVTIAAISALGRIADKTALKALLKYNNKKFQDTKNTALASGIGTMAVQGSAPTATKIAAMVMSANDTPAPLRAACAKAQLINDPAYFNTGIKDACPMVKETLIRHADQVPDSVLTAAMVKASPSVQVAIITKLAAKNSVASAPAIAGMLNSGKVEIICAALKALCKIGGANQVEAMFAKLSDNESAVKKSAVIALNDMLSKDTSAKLIEIAGDDVEKQRAVLKILSARMIATDLPKYAAFIKSSDANVRKDGWKAIGKTASEESYKQLMSWLPLIQESEITQVESAIRSALRNINPELRKAALLKAWSNATAPAKITLINLMVQYSDDAFVTLISKAMTDPNSGVAESAIRTLGRWPTIKPYKNLIDTIKMQRDPNLKKSAYRSALKLAMTKGDKNRDKLCADLFKNAPTTKERETLTTLYFKASGVDTFTLLKQCFNDAICSTDAKKLYLKLYDVQIKPNGNIGRKELDPKMWKATASHGQSEVKNAFDRNPGSRWTSGASKKGMWFNIDLSQASFISEILLDTTGSGRDTPNGYEVFVSNDNKTWGSPAAKGDGNSKNKTLIKLSATGRHIKIVTTGKRQGLHWSIHEIYIKTGMDKNLLKELKTTADSLR